METAANSDGSVSPMTRPAPKLQTDGLADGSHAPSPLRQAVAANGTALHSGPRSGPPSVRSPGGTTRTDEFPFDAQPGATGETPTNELLSQVRTADLSGPPTASKAMSMDNDEGADVHTDLISPNGGISRRQTGDVDSGTPTGRRSVQFARKAADASAPAAHSRDASRDQENAESPAKDGQTSGQRLMSKLKSLATPTSHGRSGSGWTLGSFHTDKQSDALATPGSERGEPSYGLGDSEADADAESGGDIDDLPEGTATRPRARTRRRSRRTADDGVQTAPTTPRNNVTMRHFQTQGARDGSAITPQSSASTRPNFPRSATATDMPDHRVGLSEDEGRERFRLRAMAAGRGLTYSGRRTRVGDGQDDQQRSSRPGNLRRITGFGAGGQRDTATRSSMMRPKGERQSTFGVQKWQQLKAGLKTFMQREKLRVDHAKSAELMAELLAGAPAALVAASMFQRDEHGRKRIPVLLEQLKVRVTENKKINDRHNILTVELEYGNGLTRMKWVIHRSATDFGKLWFAYRSKQAANKFKLKRGKVTKLPKFPTQVFPYLRKMGAMLEDEEEDEEAAAPAPATDAEASGTESRPRNPQTPDRRKQSFLSRHASSMNTPGSARTRQGSNAGATSEDREKSYTEMQRKAIEEWLRKMITAFYFRADSNRLCMFLELSALGVRLGAEGSYHGKEGRLMIKSGKGMDVRAGWNPHLIKERHTPKWFLVRHSYVVCVDSPEEMNIYDVILLDGDFELQKKTAMKREEDVKDLAIRAKQSTKNPRYHHQLRISNSERKLKLLGSHREIINQFEGSITFMKQNSPWGLPDKRFGSFAPVRHNVYAQWLVDGRDYFWQVSKAISRARDVIYIHDWWLSPEVYMRRPPAISQKWRLDRLLQRKAREGVKIFVIMYKNIDAAIPIDSEYSKFSLLDLHSNVFVQRSPNQMRQGTFFWSHHEKICIIDHNIAFCGGVDLCFGRWDTPSHTLVDDKLTGFELNDQPKDEDHVQMWPGKDYSNPRVQDFYDLFKPYEEMYDRSRIPRMPWHDVGMQIVGQPARDLTRHFVQRWNYILRQRIPTRPTPFLLPPPDFSDEDLAALDMHGTCEIQILRSSCDWSLGINKPEHSIMNAYVKLIEESDHLVYMENQFFITSCYLEGTKIENLIGDALVARIIRAWENGEDWRAIIVIPLMPGYQNTVDSSGGSSVRLIMSCQYSSICRGETSIFERLRAKGIEPEDYIQFYALRQWGKIGPNKTLVTEQLYIHAKVMVVDDRSAIIGSANINERSLLGTRDSEIAAVVRDHDMIDSQMAGLPYQVGRFPHTLRMRLMQEHLGIDVDELAEEERAAEQAQEPKPADEPATPRSYPASPNAADRATELQLIESHHRLQDEMIARAEVLHNVNHDLPGKPRGSHPRTDSENLTKPYAKHDTDAEGAGTAEKPRLNTRPQTESRDSVTEDGHERLVNGHATRKSNTQPNNVSSSREGIALPPAQVPRMDTVGLGLPLLSSLPALPVVDDTDIGAPPLERKLSNISADFIIPLIREMRRPVVQNDCMKDPLDDTFYSQTWHQVAENNTRIYRNVFRCQPDNEVKTWEDYRQYAAFGERFSEAQGAGKSEMAEQQEHHNASAGPPGHGMVGPLDKVGALLGKVIPGPAQEKEHRISGNVHDWKAEEEKRKSAEEGGTGPEQATELNEKVSSDVKRANSRKKGSPNLSIGNKNANGGERTPAAGGASLDEKAPSADATDTRSGPAAASQEPGRNRTITISEPNTLTSSSTNNMSRDSTRGGSQSKRGQRRRGATKSSTRQFHASDDVMLDKHDAEELLKMVQGTLVLWPYDWLVKEERNWLYAVDQLSPLEIYA